MDHTPVELTRDQVLEAVKIAEQLKLDMRLRMYDFVTEQKDNPNIFINSKMKTEEYKMNDILFEKTGFEVTDIEQSIARL